MNLSASFQVNQPNVILETFDDEVVIVNLDNGNYYSLDATGMQVWHLLESGAALAQIGAHLAAQTSGSPAEINEALTNFVNELLAEALLVPAPTATDSSAITEPVATAAAPIALPPFSAPVLNKYSDMQELLLLDPIHDVDATGWPTLPQTVGEGQ